MPRVSNNIITWKKFCSLLILIFLFVDQPAYSQAQSNINIDDLDSYFSQALKDWNVPGMAIAIVKDNKVILAKGYGVRDIRESTKVDENTLFAIASNTKAFTSATLAILADEGKIDWDDRVQQYLPYFQLYNPYVSYDMRIRDLLCHGSGLGTYSGDLIWYGTNYSAEETVKRARFLEPAGLFRASYGYSNIMYIAAGEVVSAVAGKPWKDYVQEKILDKLDMTNTISSISLFKNRINVATPHKLKNVRTIPIDWYNWDSMVAAGGFISSVSDMAKWIQLQLDKGMWQKTQIFSEKSSRTMWTLYNSLAISKETKARFPSIHFRGYGLGWYLQDYKGHLIAMHGGGYDGMFSRVALVPEENLGMVILTNSMTSIQTALVYKIFDAFLDGDDRDWSREYLEIAAKEKQKKLEDKKRFENNRVLKSNPSLPLEQYAGTYGGPMYGDAVVNFENEKLIVQFLPNPELIGDLIHWHYDTFTINWRKEFAWFDEGTVQFIFGKSGKITEMQIDVPNEDLWFTELEFQRKD
jgi:CubicO group peptidase (beta-lactamase class C family)